MYKTKLQTNGKLDLYINDKFLGRYTRTAIDRVIAIRNRNQAEKKLAEKRIKRLERGLI